jgi:two-component system nitrate/nitrite response regulator NarL
VTDTAPDAPVRISAGLPLRVRVVAETPALAAGLGALAAAAGLSVLEAGVTPPEPPEAVLVSAGVPFTPDLLAALAGAGVVVVGGDPDRVVRALAGRVRGWGVVPGSAEGPVIAAALRLAAAGLTVVPATSSPLISDGPPPVRDASGDDVPEEPLTPREREVLELVAEGLSNRAIAARLGISDHTVKFHLASIFGKLGVATRTLAVRRGLSRGLITV